MKYNLIKFSFLVFSTTLWFRPSIVYSQNSNDNHRKYWYYRSRLTNDFMKVGLNSGESMVFNQRGFESGGVGFTNPYYVQLNIGDGTSTLGYYIGLLATEYYLLSQNNQSTDKVKHELFCALNAINRLDAVAETALMNNATNYFYALNGFFVRDDVPKNFVSNNFGHFNYFDNGGNSNNPDASRGFASKYQKGAYRGLSGWQGAVEDGGSTKLFYESQDQVYNLLFGIAMVNKFVPSYETDGAAIFGYGSGETSLTTEARNIAGRIIDHVRDSKHVISGNSCGSGVSTGWTIYNPLTCNPVVIGAEALVYAYPLAELECLIKNGHQSNTGTNFGLGAVPQLCSGSGYHNTWSRTAGYLAWNIDAQALNVKVDGRVFIENLSAACNCVYGTRLDQVVQTLVTWLNQSPLTSWLGFIIGWLYSVGSQLLYITIPGIITNTTETAINVNAYSPDSPLDHGPLARKILHGGSYTPNQNHTIDYLLNVAPCDGIYALPGGYFGHQEWSSSDRLDHPERMWGSGYNNDFYGEYPAIDYMLYHNLWYIHQKQEGIAQNIVDLSDIYINNPTGLGCSNVNAYETIRTNNTNISCTSPTYWRAGKTIYFGSGTSITGNGSTTSGPNFHAYIQKFDCATDVGAYRTANTDSTANGSNSIADDSYANGVRFHTINYPPNEMATLNTEPITDHDQNLITELPTDEDPIDNALKMAYPDYSKELFIKPTVTSDNVRAYFTMDDNETAFITVMDLNGKKVFSNDAVKPTDTGLTIDLSSYAAGSYILKFTTTNGTNKTQKIIKQ